jgi:hypothetical protein
MRSFLLSPGTRNTPRSIAASAWAARRLLAIGVICQLGFNALATTKATAEEPIRTTATRVNLLASSSEKLPTLDEAPIRFQVQQIVSVDQIEKGAKTVRGWVSIPSDAPYQKLLRMEVVRCPGTWKIVSDLEHRGQFVAFEASNFDSERLDVEVSFELVRSPVLTPVQPSGAQMLSDGERQMFTEFLAKDSPNMEVSPEVQKMADEVCGDETNLAAQAIALMKHVAAQADHYSYSTDPKMPKCGIGNAKQCLAQGGGCCTDLNSLFIALARSRGIPARLNMGYRLKEEDNDRLVDSGYRCWAEYYVPGYGWVVADIVEADRPGGLGMTRWLTGLTARRLWLNQGRQFSFDGLDPEQRINHMSIAYVEVDGKPARLLPEGDLTPQITRKIRFNEVKPE